MTYTKLPRNTPDLLRKHGLKVVEIDGWYDRGRPASTGELHPGGVLCHHTAGHDDIGDPGDDLAYVKNVLVKGRADLPGPLCNFALSAEGVVYLVAAGRSNHAGKAKASGTMAGGDGNALYWGIEAMNAGNGKDVWEKSQYEAYVTLCAAISVEITGNSHQTVRAHKETSVTGKIDPAGPIAYLNEKSFDMGKFRSRVAAKMIAMKTGKTAPAAPAAKQIYWKGERLELVKWVIQGYAKNGNPAQVKALEDILKIIESTPWVKQPKGRGTILKAAAAAAKKAVGLK